MYSIQIGWLCVVAVELQNAYTQSTDRQICSAGSCTWLRMRHILLYANIHKCYYYNYSGFVVYPTELLNEFN
jgi:hypothetical protein